ncbi:predicted protein [Histoplasma capsulatum var. duboisii H88]|uniref:Predicted protein n=1 Tax=Ajellomyces capsulatus (strain H88) TaxID=544711 RepID=F0UN37_AJEC8|nr:predicted protein [Histoplasma capsulatum var. duboisii H88]
MPYEILDRGVLGRITAQRGSQFSEGETLLPINMREIPKEWTITFKLRAKGRGALELPVDTGHLVWRPLTTQAGFSLYWPRHQKTGNGERVTEPWRAMLFFLSLPVVYISGILFFTTFHGGLYYAPRKIASLIEELLNQAKLLFNDFCVRCHSKTHYSVTGEEFGIFVNMKCSKVDKYEPDHFHYVWLRLGIVPPKQAQIAQAGL